MKHIAIIGATSAMAEHCARLWAEREDVTFSLVARNRDKCEKVKKDLLSRNPNTECSIYQADFTDPDDIYGTVENLAKVPVDIALIAHGALPNQTQCESDLSLCNSMLVINGTSPALFAEALASKMAPLDHGHIAIIGSVAGDRGRKSNYTYGAAKGLVERYAQGLQHRFAGTGVSIALIKPGPTQTPMTAAISGSESFADVSQVAKSILKAIEAHKETVYVPGKWRGIMFIIRNLPRFIFKKLDI